jgi:MFS family permease
MKLNYKRVILVGMAFFLISAFWQAYDAIIPLILTNHFGLPQTASGVIMSLDNILAVFMLPVFGALSDKVNSRFGRRTPFISIGTIIAVAAFFVLSFIDNYQLSLVISQSIPELSAEATEEFVRQTTFDLTLSNPLPMIGFLFTLLVVLVAMATFRSPAVALLPDVTPKPLRSKANAIINLMGSAGGIIVLILGIVFATSKKTYMPYIGYIGAVCAVMLLGFAVFLIFVKEKKWAEDMEKQSAEFGISDEPATPGEKHVLSSSERRSLLLILASVALWFIGYNSITSKYSVYASNILGFDFNLTLIVAQAAAIIAYVPVGLISSKFGRKKTVLAGVLLLAAAFFIGIFITPDIPEIIMYPVFALAGIGWATINVNSFPMVVELAKRGDTGKYTGYYYTASMSAQIIAPILSGFLYDIIGMRYVFFPFGVLFVLFSFVTMLFVKHGDPEKIEKKSVLEHLDVGD